MTDTDKARIEKEALAFAVSKDVATCSYHIGCRVGYIAGAKSEHELLTPQLEYANNTIKKFSEALATRDGNLTSKVLNEKCDRLQQELQAYSEIIERQQQQITTLEGRNKSLSE